MPNNFNIEDVGRRAYHSVEQQALSRSFRASNVLRNSSLLVLRGQRSGKRYKVPFTRRYYTASEPGEPPAIRTGTLRSSWLPRPHFTRGESETMVYAGIHSNVPYIKYLEPALSGRVPGNKVKPRPFVNRIKQRSMKQIKKIYSEPYF